MSQARRNRSLEPRMEPVADNPPEDRRWHPPGDPGEWIQRTRQSIFDSVRRCVSHALYASLRSDSSPHEVHASDAVFRELHVCTQAYARALYALGQNEDGAAGLIVAAAREAVQPEELHASLVAAIDQWCREEHAAGRRGNAEHGRGNGDHG